MHSSAQKKIEKTNKHIILCFVQSVTTTNVATSHVMLYLESTHGSLGREVLISSLNLGDLIKEQVLTMGP